MFLKIDKDKAFVNIGYKYIFPGILWSYHNRHMQIMQSAGPGLLVGSIIALPKSQNISYAVLFMIYTFYGLKDKILSKSLD